MSSMQEQIAQGSLKSSHRNTHAIVLKKALPHAQNAAIEFLTNNLQDLVICQKLNIENKSRSTFTNDSGSTFTDARIGSLFTKATFFVHSTNTKAEPGFLVFLNKNMPIYIRYNLSKKEREFTRGHPICYSLRMRVSQEIYKGSVFIVSLDVVNHSMLIEDVYVYKGKNVFNNETFTERRKYMKDFVQHHWIPDARLLGGIVTNVMNPLPLSELEKLVDVEDYTKVFLIPDTAGKRRFTFTLNDSVAKIDAREGYYGRKTSEPMLSIPKVVTIETKPTYAKAVRDTILPDVYELFDVDGKSLSKACVQQLDLSKKLKDFSGDIMVNISYNEDFKKYEIIGLHKNIIQS